MGRCAPLSLVLRWSHDPLQSALDAALVGHCRCFGVVDLLLALRFPLVGYLIQVLWGIGIIIAMSVIYEFGGRFLSWLYEKWKP